MISGFTPGIVGLGMADPLADHRSQLVRLLLQSANPLRLDNQIATQLCDLPLDRERQCDGRLRTSSPHAGYGSTLNIRIRLAS